MELLGYTYRSAIKNTFLTEKGFVAHVQFEPPQPKAAFEPEGFMRGFCFGLDLEFFDLEVPRGRSKSVQIAAEFSGRWPATDHRSFTEMATPATEKPLAPTGCRRLFCLLVYLAYDRTFRKATITSRASGVCNRDRESRRNEKRSVGNQTPLKPDFFGSLHRRARRHPDRTRPIGPA